MVRSHMSDVICKAIAFSSKQRCLDQGTLAPATPPHRAWLVLLRSTDHSSEAYACDQQAIETRCQGGIADRLFTEPFKLFLEPSASKDARETAPTGRGGPSNSPPPSRLSPDPLGAPGPLARGAASGLRHGHAAKPRPTIGLHRGHLQCIARVYAAINANERISK